MVRASMAWGVCRSRTCLENVIVGLGVRENVDRLVLERPDLALALKQPICERIRTHHRPAQPATMAVHISAYVCVYTCVQL
jgi:argininosuccinate lyase